MKKYLFLIILPLLMFLPHDVFASEGYYTNYYSDLQDDKGNVLSSVKTGYYGLQLFDNEYYFYYGTPKNPGIGWQNVSKVVISVYSDIADGLENFTPASSNTSYLQFINSGLTIRLLTTVNGTLTGSYCTFTENSGNYYLLTCPVPTDSTNLRGFRVQYDDVTLGDTLTIAPKIGFSRDINFYTKDITVSDAIEDSTQDIIDSNKDTQDKIDNVDSTLNNSDVDSATNSGTGFFDSFNSSDNGGISGIITAPLNSINAMLNGSCTPLQATYKGKNISLQCGTEMWNKLGDIKEFLNLVLGGLLCYRICLRIFNIVQNLKNPDNDKVEVMDL